MKMGQEDSSKRRDLDYPSGNQPIKTTTKLTQQVISCPSRNGCHHQSPRLWTEDNDVILRNMFTILIHLQSSQRNESDVNLSLFCLHCHSGTNPRLICLGCGAVYCVSNHEKKNHCYQIAHSTKSNRCHLGLDLTCRELLCLVCARIIQPDVEELKLLNRRLFPQIKRSFAPGCLNRITSNIFPPKGFRNLGNSCYMNVVLQIILRIPEIQSYLLTDHHNRLKHRTATQDEVYCCACELVEILQSHSGLLENQSVSNDSQIDRIRSSSNHDSVISPVGFLYSLWINSDGEDFAGYRESDAHECLLACLNQLHTATQVPTNPTTTPTTVTIRPSTNDNTTNNPITKTVSNINESTNCQCPIHLLFRCQLSSQLVCGHCGNLSEKIDPILDLSLEIQHLNHLQTLKLEDCLDNFTKRERLKEHCFTCTDCGVASPETTKSLTISKLPHILCIQLKRFEHLGTSSIKLDRHVKFPLVLNMQPYTCFTTPEKNVNFKSAPSPGYYYKLAGIVKHQGNVSSGHYQAIVYQDDLYFCFNDGQVNILRLKEVLDTEAYILVYSFLPTDSLSDV